MKEGNTSLVIAAFIALIIGIVLIGVVASTTSGITTKDTVYAEVVDISTARLDGFINITQSNISIANAPAGKWQQTDCPVTAFAIGNGTDNFTVTTDYIFYGATGIINFQNTSTVHGDAATPNTTYAYYTYCDDDYINSSWGRTAQNLVPGFFALALLATSLILFYGVAKDEGLLNR